jgi:glycosyltransferase involved in cell wall biosynthesis
MKRPIVSFFVHDLASNPIVRAAPLARALSSTHDVEILGFLLSGDEVYAPYRDLFTFKTMKSSPNVAAIVRAIPELAARASGDVIYACKPLVTTLVPALLAAHDGHRKLLLDAEDDEWVPMGSGWSQFLWRDVVKGWRHATAWKYTRGVHPLVWTADGVTVSSRRLQRRYGGRLLRHGPDEHLFDPGRPELRDRRRCRARWALPDEVSIALFAGMPQPHKGWSVLLDALKRPEASLWHLALAGPRDDSEFERARIELGARCHPLGPQPHEAMPALLAAVDAVPVPQVRCTFAESQIPAKAIEAMAMGKPVVASSVGDLPEILGHGARGWLIAPGSADDLAAALAEIARDRTEAARRGAAARDWFVREASTAAMRATLEPLIAA